MLCIGYGEAKTGKGLSLHSVVLDRTPHPTEFGSTGGAVLSHKGRGRINAHRDVFFRHPHSAASASGAVLPRSTTRNVVRMRWVVPSWKRITVSTGISRLPP